MSFSSSFSGSTASALRASLVEIKPVEKRERVQKHGIQYTIVKRSFESTAKEDYYKYCEIENDNLLDFIKIPSRFEREKVLNILNEMDKESFDKDTELNDAYERLLNEKSSRDIEPLITYLEFLKNRKEKRIKDQIRAESRMYLVSDLPFNLFDDFVTYRYTVNTFIDSLLRITKRHRRYFRTSRARNTFQIYQRHFNNMQSELKPVIDHLDELIFSRNSLVLYLMLTNAENYEKIKNLKNLSREKLEMAEFERLRKQLDYNIRFTRQFLFTYKNYTPIVEEIKEDDPTARMLSKLILSVN